jgi:hypothetical protein
VGNWNQVLGEINKSYDGVRREYLKALSDSTGRNVVAYYSGWLQKTGDQFFNVANITDEDKEGFMSCFYGLDKDIGLDLLIHSPGGSVTATESLIHYIRAIFGRNIRVFIPQIAMSGGTILALCGREIWMGKQSNLRPIDPRFGSMAAVTLIEEFERAYAEIKKQPTRMKVWSPILGHIAPTLLTQAAQAIELSHAVAIKTLTGGMFQNNSVGMAKARKIARELTNVKTHKEHGRHIHADDARKMGLKIIDLESDNELQDAVLSVHHAFVITLQNTPAAKIIENHLGAAFVKNVQQTAQLIRT